MNILLVLCIVHNVLDITRLGAFECTYIGKHAKFIKLIQGNGTPKSELKESITNTTI